MTDLLIFFENGTVELLKSYGGDNPYESQGTVMLIADSIRDVSIGDVDGNGYEDVLIRTSDSTLKAYRNYQGVYDVDGTPVCLDTSS